MEVGIIGKYLLFCKKKEQLDFKLIFNFLQENMNTNLK
jgi:hypothetical protein